MPEKVFHIITDELLVRLLIGKTVRYLDNDRNQCIGVLISIVDEENKIYYFKNNEDVHSQPYMVEGAIIMVHDWDWDLMDGNINNSDKLQVKKK